MCSLKLLESETSLKNSSKNTETNYYSLLTCMDTQPEKIPSFLVLNILCLISNMQNVVCYPKFLLILLIFFDIIHASLGYLHSNKKLVEGISTVIILLELIHTKHLCIVILTSHSEKTSLLHKILYKSLVNIWCLRFMVT